MTRGASPPPADEAPRANHRIGEVAERFGVSTRTLRYYQELGLLAPAGASPGGNRRYSDADIARIERIIELRNVMGFELDRIGVILAAEDRLAELRREVAQGVTSTRRGEILTEAMSINVALRAQVADKLAVLQEFAGELQATAARYRDLAAELGIDFSDEVPPGPIQIAAATTT